MQTEGSFERYRSERTLLKQERAEFVQVVPPVHPSMPAVTQMLFDAEAMRLQDADHPLAAGIRELIPGSHSHKKNSQAFFPGGVVQRVSMFP